MIELSPLDVRNKKNDFTRSLRGYDPEEVDSFLELTAERLERLVTERRRLTDRVEELEERLAGYRGREGAMNEALLTAQELREEARAQAERDAELTRREARAEAEEILGEARESVRRAREDLERLRTRRERFLRSFRGTLQRFLDELEVEEARLDRERAGRGDAPALEDELEARADVSPDDGVVPASGEDGASGTEPEGAGEAVTETVADAPGGKREEAARAAGAAGTGGDGGEEEG